MNFGFVTLLKFYISDGLGGLFLDTPVHSKSKVTFRSGFKTHNHFWDVSSSILAVLI